MFNSTGGTSCRCEFGFFGGTCELCKYWDVNVHPFKAASTRAIFM